uniref:Uncharacterized protein n=1 Tax=Trepomonas sp. PC1 TaxID=1076344 RepID=A0A146KD26_9EUKA|eukprot:JAP93595.1 hypothetical protein TPC1_14065 [Trepomonas sp. PC1]
MYVENKNNLTNQQNCYQAVVAGLTSPKNKQIEKASNYFSGGRAPFNMCGALYAAINMSPEKHDDILSKFQHLAGGTTCSEVKNKNFSCSELVDLAMKLAK